LVKVEVVGWWVGGVAAPHNSIVFIHCLWFRVMMCRWSRSKIRCLIYQPSCKVKSAATCGFENHSVPSCITPGLLREPHLPNPHPAHVACSARGGGVYRSAVHLQFGILVFWFSVDFRPNVAPKPQCRLHQKSAPQTNSKAISWQFGIRSSPPPMNR
jgi:hypothetical protein